MKLSKRVSLIIIGCALILVFISNLRQVTAEERTTASKPKRIEIVVVESGVRAEAELLEARCPITSAALWKTLEKPIIAQGIHAAWTGRCVYLVIPEANLTFDPAEIPFENATLYPIPGDVLFAFSPQSVEKSVVGSLPDIGIVYGREVRFYDYSGQHAMNLWARITKGLEELAAECSKLRIEGAKEFRIARIAD